MGLLSKVKEMFIYEDEPEETEEIKKEVIQVKIPTPERKKEEVEIEDVIEEKDEVEEKVEPKKEEFLVEKKEESTRFSPRYFDDSDFEMPGERIVEPEIVKQEYKYTRTETIIKPSGGAYSGLRKENTRNTFTPTPIISPVYGILDKNYKKEEITTKKRPTKIYSQFDKIDVDDIRNKAFGNFEEEIDIDLGLRERDTIIFNDDIDVKIEPDVEITDYEEQPLDIFKEMEKKDALDALLDNYTIDDSYKEEIESEMEESKVLVEEELNRNYDNYEKELEQSYKEDLNDSDLFNLIDSMYNNGESE